MEWRWAEGDGERLRAYATELVALRPDVILLNGTPALTAVRQHTQTTPIVFVNVGDPVGSGLIASLARPGGHITGFTNYEYSMGGKWLELLKEVTPRVIRCLAVFNSENASHKGLLQAVEAVASSAAIRLAPLDISSPSNIEAAVDNFAKAANGGLIVLPDFRTTTYRDRIIDWRPATTCRVYSRFDRSQSAAVCWSTRLTPSNSIGAEPHLMRIVSCGAAHPDSCPCRRRPNLSW